MSKLIISTTALKVIAIMFVALDLVVGSGYAVHYFAQQKATVQQLGNASTNATRVGHLATLPLADTNSHGSLPSGEPQITQAPVMPTRPTVNSTQPPNRPTPPREIGTYEWLIFQSSKYGFSFMYPRSESCHEQKIEWTVVALYISCNSFWLEIYSNKERLAVGDFFLTTGCTANKPLCEYIMDGSPLENTTIGHIQVIKTVTASNALPHIIFTHNKYIFTFNGRSNKDHEVLDRVTSTFMFTAN